ncbi:MAG: sensor histidine kinase [Myxococcales bacterium]
MPAIVISYCVLVVDDEPLALNLVQRVFASETDIELHTAISPTRALEVASRQDIDLVVTDQRMPEMTGLTLLGRLREIRPGAQRILLTAYPDMEVALAAINDGMVYRFVLKPWDMNDMRVSIRRALEAKRIADEHQKLTAQLKTQFEELVRAERLAAVGRLSAGLGHELANAVTPLLLHVDLLADQFPPLHAAFRAASDALAIGFTADALRQLSSVLGRLKAPNPTLFKETLDALQAAGNHLQALVQGIKSVARNSPEPVPFDVNQAVLSAVHLLGHRFKRGIRLVRELNALPAVRCRGSEIAQVVLNLLGNAADAVEGGKVPTVRVRTWEADGRVHVEVADTGAGIDPKVRNRLFQPFMTTKDPGRGTGLGLSICKSIVESHGGSITVDSEPGQGARFVFALPAIA